MANSITSVSSSASAALQIQQPRADRPNPTQENGDSQAAREADRARQAQRPREPEAPPAPRPPEATRPVVNVEGQTTGRVINTTA